ALPALTVFFCPRRAGEAGGRSQRHGRKTSQKPCRPAQTIIFQIPRGSAIFIARFLVSFAMGIWEDHRMNRRIKNLNFRRAPTANQALTSPLPLRARHLNFCFPFGESRNVATPSRRAGYARNEPHE